MVSNKSLQPIEVINEGEMPSYSPDGVDLSLIRWMLSLTPKERLDYLQQQVNTIYRIRSGGKKTN